MVLLSGMGVETRGLPVSGIMRNCTGMFYIV